MDEKSIEASKVNTEISELYPNLVQWKKDLIDVLNEASTSSASEDDSLLILKTLIAHADNKSRIIKIEDVQPDGSVNVDEYFINYDRIMEEYRKVQ